MRIYYFLIIPVAALLYAAYMIFKMKADGKRRQEWLEQNPNASKVFIGKGIPLIKNILGTITVISVDGERPIFFMEKLRTGFYAAPGTHVVESTFEKTRPGILYRTVTTKYGPSKQEITVGSSQTYAYSFDRKNETYSFEEITE
ncbi:MAG: hypothetical protein ACTTKL_04005 [Treponema sp.]